MIKNVLHLYALLVCFITVIILMITFSLSLNFVTDLLIPDYKYSSSLRHYQSNETYIQYYKDMEGQKEKAIALALLSPSQLDQKRLDEQQHYLEDKKMETIASLIVTLQWILVAFIFFFIHWKIYQRSKACEDTAKK